MVVALAVADESVQNEPVRQKRFLGHLVEVIRVYQ